MSATSPVSVPRPVMGSSSRNSATLGMAYRIWAEAESGGSSQRLRWAIRASVKAITNPMATETTVRNTCWTNGST